MSLTKSSFLGMVVAILKATTFDRCSMCDTYSPLHDMVGTPLKATSFSLPLRAMGEANSPLHGAIGTPLVAASLHLPLSTISDTNSTLHNLIGTPLVFALLLFAPCVIQTPPFLAPLVQPSNLQRFFFAP